MLRPLWKLWLKWRGWDVRTSFPYHNLPRYILIVAPHTSNWDFVIGLAYRSLFRLQHIHFLGKEELFRPPWGFFFRWLGGTPVNRKHSHQVVETIAALFKENKRYVLALSPEGTRKRVERLRSGFYFIAQTAGVPIAMVGFDYQNKCVKFTEPLYPSGNFEEDEQRVISFFRPIQGRNAAQGLGHL